MASSSFPLDPVPEDTQLAVVFSNADQFQLFDVPRNFICSVGTNLVATNKSRFLFLFEDVLLITKSDDKRAWDEGAYLILARLDLVDVSVLRETDDVFLLRVDGVGDQRFQMRDHQHMMSFLDRLKAARDARKGAATPRSDSEQSPSPSPLFFRREQMWPRDTLTGAAIEEELSEEFDLRVNSQAELVDMVRRAYASDGFLSNPRSFLAVKTDNNANSLAVETLRSTLRGTALESPDLERATTLEEAKAALLRVVGLSEEQRNVLANYNSNRVQKKEQERVAADRARNENEVLAASLRSEMKRQEEQHVKSLAVLKEQVAKLEKENALLDMKLSSSVQRANEAEKLLARAKEGLEDKESQLEKERAQQKILKEMLADQQKNQALQQRTSTAVAPSKQKTLAETLPRSSKLVIETNRSPLSEPGNSSMADFSIAEEDLDSILGEFVVASPTVFVSPQTSSEYAADQTLRSVPTSSKDRAALTEVVDAVSGLTQELGLGLSSEGNAVKNLELARSEARKQKEEIDRLKSALERADRDRGKEKQALESSFRMSETASNAARKEAAELRETNKKLERELEAARRDNTVLRDSSRSVADNAKAAIATESESKTALREAQREIRRLKAELEETEGALKTAQTIANDATERARQERARGSTLTKARVDEESSSLNATQARSATEELRKAFAKHVALRAELADSLSTRELKSVMAEHDKQLDNLLRAVETPLGIRGQESSAKNNNSDSLDVSSEVKAQQLRVEAARLELSLQNVSSDLVETRDKLKAEHVARVEAERLVGVERSRVAFLESRVVELTHDLRVTRDELTAAEAKHQQYAAVEKKVVASLQSQVAEAKQRAERDEKRAAEAVAAVAVANGRAQEEKERADKLEQQLREARAAEASKVATLEKQWSEAQQRAAKAAESSAEMERLKEMEKQWMAAEKSAASTAELERLKQELATKSLEAENLQGDVEDLQGELTAIKAQLAAALGSCTKLRQEKGELQHKVEKLSATVKELLKHSNEQASELKLEKSRSASIRASPKGSPRLSPHRAGSPAPADVSMDSSAEQQLKEVVQQLRAASDKLEASEKKAANLMETNKALLARINEMSKAKK